MSDSEKRLKTAIQVRQRVNMEQFDKAHVPALAKGPDGTYYSIKEVIPENVQLKDDGTDSDGPLTMVIALGEAVGQETQSPDAAVIDGRESQLQPGQEVNE